MTETVKKHIRVGHSPDPDDAFMFYALAHQKIDTGAYELKDVVKDIETLNQMALRCELEITAVSVHAFAHVAKHYALMPCGASIGDRYGPILVSKKKIARRDLSTLQIAVPGELTTALLALRLFEPHARYAVIPFDQITTRVADGSFDAGLIIHEGQLAYQRQGFQLIVDLGVWWHDETGLPLPLGVDVIRKDLHTPEQESLTRLLRDSIVYARGHRQEALRYALKFGRGISINDADRFVGMYVNEMTVDGSSILQPSIHELFRRAHAQGILEFLPDFDLISLD